MYPVYDEYIQESQDKRAFGKWEKKNLKIKFRKRIFYCSVLHKKMNEKKKKSFKTIEAMALNIFYIMVIENNKLN